jgi:hypothetical protein
MPEDLNQEDRPRLAWYDRGPGPAAFLLPTLIGRKNHALTHRINPEYSFGLKNDLNRNPVGPGWGKNKIDFQFQTIMSFY